MPTKPEAFEYWGSQVPTKEAIARDAHEPAAATGPRGDPGNACGLGHDWPQDDIATGSRACRRCGKPSALPAGFVCSHGVPLGGTFGGHSCAYTEARDALIPYAAAAADRDTADGGATSEVWDRRFHHHMERLMALARRVA